MARRLAVYATRIGDGDDVAHSIPASWAGHSDSDVLRRLGLGPSEWSLSYSRPVIRRLSAPTELAQSPVTSSASDVRVAVLSLGGMGDDLVKLNVARQLRGMLPLHHASAHITYVGRQRRTIFDAFDFVDAWRFISHKPVDEVSALVTREYDLTFDLRYTGQVLTPGTGWLGDAVAGKDLREPITQTLPRSLGPYAFEDDGLYLRHYLCQVSPGMTESLRLRHATRRGKYVVVANGADEMFAGDLTKRIPDDVLRDAAERLWASHGVYCVEVGTDTDRASGLPRGVNLVGKTSLEGLIWLVTRADGVLSCEGGVAHLASHLRVPTAVLCGPTPAAFWGYLGNLNLQADGGCPIHPCWFSPNEPRWHLECVAQKRGIAAAGQPPQCMAAFDGVRVADAFAAHMVEAV